MGKTDWPDAGLKKPPVVIWHAGCTDGFAALWAVYRAFGEVEAVRGYYQSTDEEIARLTELIAGREVFIVDLSYPLDVIQRWRGHAKRIVLLDHHKTAFEKLAPLLSATEPIDHDKARKSVVTEPDLTIVLDKDRSGCGITWDYLFGAGPAVVAIPHTERPWLINYVEDRDTWKFALDNSREINAFVKHQDQTFERWDCMADALTLSDAVLSGIAAKTVVDHYVEKAVNTARIVALPGPDGIHLVPAVNALYWNTSEAVEALAETPMCLVLGLTMRDAMAAHAHFVDGGEEPFLAPRSGATVIRDTMVDHPPFALAWHVRSDGMFAYSLRSRKPGAGADDGFDVSRLAAMYGGGGHRGSAGFSVGRPVHEPIPGGGLDLHEAAAEGAGSALKALAASESLVGNEPKVARLLKAARRWDGVITDEQAEKHADLVSAIEACAGMGDA